MNQPEITPELIEEHGISADEYERIKEIMGREPNFTELGVFSVMWSEHCSYKSSRVHLKRLPTTGERVVVPPGENAGVVDIGDGWCVAFKVESHNHPSFIEPFQGAATGVGGILRDVFTMGARPIAAMNSLRFGHLDDKKHGNRNKSILKGVVEGIAHYGNCLTASERLVINDADGTHWITIGDFCEKFAQGEDSVTKDIEKENIYTLSFDTELNKSVWKLIKKVFKRQTQKILKVKTAKGRTLKMTEDHLALIHEDKEIKTKFAKDLKPGDRIPVSTEWTSPELAESQLDLIKLLGNKRDDIWVCYEFEDSLMPSVMLEMRGLVTTATARHKYREKGRYPLKAYLELEKKFNLDRRNAKLRLRSGKANEIPVIIDIDKKFARLLGYYLAEGCTSQNGTTDKIIWVFGKSKSDAEYVEDLCQILDEYEIRYSVRENESTKSIWLSSWFLGVLFREILNIGSNAYNKSIPKIIENQSEEIIDELLKGLFRGDGSLIYYPKNSNQKMTWATVSETLFEQVLTQLQSREIVPSIHTKPKRKAIIEGRKVQCQKAFYLEIGNYQSLKKIKTWFSESKNEKLQNDLEKVEGSIYSFPRYKQKIGFATVKIISIEEIQENVSVYDVEVEDTHNFVTTGGIITHNCFGVPTIGGEVVFDEAYNLNPLVNAFALGIVRKDQIFFGKASGIGNPVMYVGAKTGRDGIHGATMASAEFDDEALEKRPTVQVGDPFLEKLLLEACLEAMRSGAIEGIQDMGAAGLTSSSVEMADRAGNGLELYLDDVPQRETNMTAYEMLLSESQERMLIVAKKGREKELVEIFNKWDLDAVVIGKVVEGNRLKIFHHGELMADLPVDKLTESAPLYNRPMAAPGSKFKVQSSKSELSQSKNIESETLNLEQVLKKLLASPNICSKHFVYEQYDHMVRTNTAILPGADAAVVRVKETRRAVSMCLDGNGRFSAVDPKEGAKLTVAEAARNNVCVGGKPIAVTNCLNFASPERPKIMWAFSETVDGIKEACEMFETPIISGNVSFYNETDGDGVLPTPTIGMVGLIEDARKILTQGFKDEGDLIALLGTTNDDLSVSEYAQTILGYTTNELIEIGEVPKIDLHLEKKVQDICLKLIDEQLINSAHDCSDGGLSVAIAESCFSSLNNEPNGAEIELNDEELDATTLLFSESPSRIVVTFPADNIEKVKEQVGDCPFEIIGKVTGNDLKIKINGKEEIDAKVSDLQDDWKESLEKQLQI